MKKIVLYALLCTFMFTLSCGPSMNAVWQKPSYTPKHINKLAIITVSKNLEARKSIEYEIARNLRQANPNIDYVLGIELLPPNVDKSSWTEDNIKRILKEQNVDAVLTTVYVNSYISQQLENDYPMYDPWYYNTGMYLYSSYNYVYTPQYYSQSQVFVLQSSLFDVNEGDSSKAAMVWKGESQVEDPVSISDGGAAYAKNLVKYLDKKHYLD